jgi:hypothetical protein
MLDQRPLRTLRVNRGVSQLAPQHLKFVWRGASLLHLALNCGAAHPLAGQGVALSTPGPPRARAPAAARSHRAGPACGLVVVVLLRPARAAAARQSPPAALGAGRGARSGGLRSRHGLGHRAALPSRGGAAPPPQAAAAHTARAAAAHTARAAAAHTARAAAAPRGWRAASGGPTGWCWCTGSGSMAAQSGRASPPTLPPNRRPVRRSQAGRGSHAAQCRLNAGTAAAAPDPC